MSMEGSFGRIKFTDLPSAQLPDSIGGDALSTCHVQEVCWEPPKQYAVHLAPAFKIKLHCYTVRDRERRILPDQQGWKGLIANLFSAGNAIRSQNDGWKPWQRTSASLQFFAYQWILNRREYLDRRFRYSRDIYVRPTSRSHVTDRNILAPIAALHDNLRSVKSVRTMSNDDGVEVHHSQRIKAFHIGLYQIARAANKLDLPEEQVAQTIKNAFILHEQPLPDVGNDIVEEVNARLWRAFGRHQDDCSNEFEYWFKGPRSNLIGVLSRGSGRHREKRLDPSHVKAALFTLGWGGFMHVANSIDVTMRMIRNAVHDFTETEVRIFDSLYAQQSRLANFPILLLLDRQDFLEPVALDWWSGADENELITAIQRLMYFYGEMVRHRRSADRRSSQRRQSRNLAGETARQVSIREELTGSAVPPDLLSSLATSLDLKCSNCGSTRVWWTLETGNDNLRFEGDCRDCKSAMTVGNYSYRQLRETFEPEDFLPHRLL